MRRAFIVFAVVAMFALAANAGVITMTFEGLGNLETVSNYYNGGYGGSGSGPGPDYGITFGADSLALISEADGGSGNFNESPSGDTVLFFNSGSGDIMDVAAGFDTGFSFYYTAPFSSGSVTVYSGLDGTGSVLATLTLPTTPEGGTGCTYQYCPFVPFGVTFDGTAESVDFSGGADQIAFDNVTLGSSTAGGSTDTPEPAAFSLLGLGLVSLGLIARGKKA